MLVVTLGVWVRSPRQRWHTKHTHFLTLTLTPTLTPAMTRARRRRTFLDFLQKYVQATSTIIIVLVTSLILYL